MAQGVSFVQESSCKQSMKACFRGLPCAWVLNHSFCQHQPQLPPNLSASTWFGGISMGLNNFPAKTSFCQQNARDLHMI